MKSVGDLVSTSFPNLVTAAPSVYLWYYSYCNISYYSMVKFCHTWLCIPLKIWIHFLWGYIHGKVSRAILQTEQTSSCEIQCNCYSHMKISTFYNQPHLGGRGLNWAWESHFCRWVTKLQPCERFRGHRSGVSTATYRDGCSPSSSCRWLRKKTEASLGPCSHCHQCFYSFFLVAVLYFSCYRAGNNSASDPLSLIRGK